VNIKIIKWQDANIDRLRELYIRFPYPAYFGSPIVDEKMQEYRFRCVKRAAEANAEMLFAVVAGDRVLCAAQLRRTAHLSDHFGIEVAGIANEAFVYDNASENYMAFRMLIEKLRDLAEKGGVAFITTTAASQAHHWIRALEENGFRYADGFRHVTASIEEDYSAFLRNDLVMRDLKELDFGEIAYSYEHMPFPNHLLYEPEFDKGKIVSLYVKRYREVHEKLGKVFVAEWQGQFAGALNGIVDRDILRETGVAVNHLSQGLIVHPRAAGKGVALALIACRNPWYRKQGVIIGYYGSNINNLPMIRGLEKMGTRHAGIEISMILRLKDRL
jgi:GNAT superfamily N-acetyltransferase